jgi:hypothetical protein
MATLFAALTVSVASRPAVFDTLVLASKATPASLPIETSVARPSVRLNALALMTPRSLLPYESA